MRPPQTVLFDFDHTLTRGDAFLAFVLDLLQKEPLRALAPALTASVTSVGLLHPATTSVALAASLWSATLGLDEAALTARKVAFVEQLRAQGTWFYEDARRAVAAHRARGDRLVLVTGCEADLAARLCRAFEIGELEIVGSRIARVAGGWWLAEHCYHARKLSCLGRHGVQPPFDCVYTDSSRDLPLLRNARAATLVNASQATQERAQRELAERVTIVQWR